MTRFILCAHILKNDYIIMDQYSLYLKFLKVNIKYITKK